MDELTTRNLQALSEGLKQIRQQYSDLHKEVESLREHNATLQLKIQSYEQRMNIVWAKSIGTGATT
jgi:phage shock protein A